MRKKYNWQRLNNDLIRYIELNIFPNLLAFAIAKLHYNKELTNINFKTLYNQIKSILNITNENKNVIILTTNNILNTKYKLKIKMPL